MATDQVGSILLLYVYRNRTLARGMKSSIGDHLKGSPSA